MNQFDFCTKSTDPFEASEEIHREKIRRLNNEIIRLKIKCGEHFTMEELTNGFGEALRVARIGQLPASPRGG